MIVAIVIVVIVVVTGWYSLRHAQRTFDAQCPECLP